MRRRLERRGFEFNTDNDSELIAVYLADKLAHDHTRQFHDRFMNFMRANYIDDFNFENFEPIGVK